MSSTRMAMRLVVLLLVSCGTLTATSAAAAPPTGDDQDLRQLLDAPLLFTKRHSYQGIHIYDTFYKWPPGGGGIYVIENPAAPRDQWKIRPVIDPTTPETLGVGVYTDPELSWDAQRLLFSFKGEPNGSTGIYEIGIDGRGLRCLTDPSSACACYEGSLSGQHDVTPAYLPDGRIVFLSTRPSGLVPCFNTGVAILHVMNPDGSDIHPISVNNVNEFDPSILPDGRILLGRWEYVDKNALTIQSLWTMNPDGTQETALFANNMVFPEAILDARPVPGTHLIVGTFAKHNGTPRGSIALVDPRRGKNSPEAITNLEHPDQPTFDRGDSCEPWPVSEDVFLFSGRPAGHQRNVIEMIDRRGRRIVVHSDPDICLHSPMLVKPRPVPPVLNDTTDRLAATGRFFVQDVYQGLTGVERGEVKWLRVIEETSRVSGTKMGGSPYNQTFLVSAALAFSVKNYLGVVPVADDGSAFFEVPAGRALYLQALDDEGRLVQSMRTFVQASPGTTRSCIGCHEHKYGTTPPIHELASLSGREPDQLEPESWGSGYVDYASMVQPVLNKHCVRCHGGEEGIAAGMDLSGGWTEHFNISYENLANRRHTQLIAYWIAGIDCMNGTALWSARIFPPRSIGSGAAPLADLLVSGHDGYIPQLTRRERDLLMAWIDTNGLYHGTWDATESGCAIRGWQQTKGELINRMQQAGCLRCHGDGNKIRYFENDWINLQRPEFSRILRAPLPEGAEGYGLGFCRDRQVDPARQRIHLLWKGYAHAVQPPEAFPSREVVPPDTTAPPVAGFASTDDPNYQAMLAIIREARADALANPRIDMPGAVPIAGKCRYLVPPSVPETAPVLQAQVDRDGVVDLAWDRSSQLIGLTAELHRSDQTGFTPDETTLLTHTLLANYVDNDAPPGPQHYALIVTGESGRSQPTFVSVTVPPPAPPPAPTGVTVLPASCSVRLAWETPADSVFGYHVFRAKAGSDQFEQLTSNPVMKTTYADGSMQLNTPLCYVVRAVSRRGAMSEPSPPVEATAKAIMEPMLTVDFDGQLQGRLYGGQTIAGKLHGPARCSTGALDLTGGGHATLPHQPAFDLGQPITVECWVRIDQKTQMPVFVSCGLWNHAGWFLQWLGNSWRWHVGGVDCDGGRPAVGTWMHVAGTYDGRTLRLYENGRLVAEKPGVANTAPWSGDLHLGQYSGQPGPSYQVTGQITGVKIYHRPLGEREIAEAVSSRPD